MTVQAAFWEEPSDVPAYDEAEILEAAFQHYRAAGFPVTRLPLWEQMERVNALTALRGRRLATSRLGLHVADTYHPHRWKAHALGMRSPVDVWEDDAGLRKAIAWAASCGRTLAVESLRATMTIAQGAQAAANFRPGFAAYLYRRFAAEGGAVVDPCAGYGGRLVGWIASRIGGRYVACEPCSESHAGNVALAAALGADARIIRSPFEDVSASELGGPFSLAFTSPPYFAKEVYSAEPTQSAARYPTYPAWRDGFLAPLIRGAAGSLASGGHLAINIADVKIGSERHPLERDTVALASSAGLRLVEEIPYLMGVRAHDASKRAVEPCFVFRLDALDFGASGGVG